MPGGGGAEGGEGNTVGGDGQGTASVGALDVSERVSVVCLGQPFFF